MKLLIKKHSKERRFGVLAFLIYVRLEVSEAELSWLDKCNLFNEPVLQPEKIKGDGLLKTLFELSENKRARVHDLIEGHTFVCSRLDELMALENELVESTVALQRYVTIAESFGSEEVIDLAQLVEEE